MQCSCVLSLVCILSEDEDAGQIIELPQTGAFTIGRSKKCNHPVSCRKVSHMHCVLYMTGNTPDVWLKDQSMNGTWVGASRIGKGQQVCLSNGDQVSLLGPVTSTSDSANLPFAFELRVTFESKKMPIHLPGAGSPRHLGLPDLQPWRNDPRGLITLQQGRLHEPRVPEASHQQRVGHSFGCASAPAVHLASHPRVNELSAGKARWQGEVAGSASTVRTFGEVTSSISSVHSSHLADTDHVRAWGSSNRSHSNTQPTKGRAALMSDAAHQMKHVALMSDASHQMKHAALMSDASHQRKQLTNHAKARPYQPQKQDARRRLQADGSVRQVLLTPGTDPLEQVQPSSRCVTATGPPRHVSYRYPTRSQPTLHFTRPDS